MRHQMAAFRLLTVTLFAAALVPRLAHRGMFVDGVTYASIARNLAEGRGTFWAPSYTATIYPAFHEHPPLGFWLQSQWFRALGDHWLTERAYTMAAAAITALLIASIWRRLSARASVAAAQDYEWFPVALWIAVPVVSWSIVGNLLETTVSIFTTAAAAATLFSGQARRPAAAIGWAGLSGLCVVAATLTKGPIGLFPLTAPVVFFPLAASRQSAILSLATQWGTVALCSGGLAAIATARSSLAQYLDQQVLAAMAGRREVSASSLTIVKGLLQGVLLPAGIVGGLVVALARRFVVPTARERAHGLALLVLGLAGTLPILASTKQAGHYLVPAVPLYALAAASVLLPTMGVLRTRIAERGRTGAIMLLSLVVLSGTIGMAASSVGGRDRRRLADLDALEPAIPRGATIGICPESNGDWGLHAWFERRFHVSLDASHGDRREWFLRTPQARGGCPPARCIPATDTQRDLVLLRCGQP